MSPAVLPDEERRSFETLLGSKVFQRSPSQERLMRYLFEKHQAGEARGLKEYTIAVEAFHRSPEFEPKDDSIVRVEMLRLRRRLQRYYQGDGAKESVRIRIPEKSYDLEFEVLRQAGIETAPAPERILPLVPKRTRGWQYLAPIAGSVVALLVLGAIVVFAIGLSRTPPVEAKLPASPTAAEPSAAAPDIADIRILAGRGSTRYVDAYGHVWEGDRWFHGGETATIAYPQAITGYDRNVLSGYREGDFSYDIPLLPGSYELLLGFAGAGLGNEQERREFNVWANEQRLLSAFDPAFYAGGPNFAYFRSFKDIEPASDGKLHLRFSSGGRTAYINAIQIRPGTRGRLRPIRFVARSDTFRDSEGNIWEPEQFVQGGRQITRPDAPWPARDARLYHGERYGRFSYRIPVPPGRYQVNLYFWESWWGKTRQGGGGPGSRIFSVFCNYNPLVQNLDILREATGAPALHKTFQNLEPGADGHLQFDFVPIVNNALINAIEIIDESR